MSEVEKMYENAEVKFIIGVHCRAKIGDGCKSRCPDCDYNTKPKDYPPFTAEKQIAILQLLTQQCDLMISHFGEWKFIHYDGQEPTQVTGEDFAETFAKLINAYWQDLTEEEKQEIKRILT